MPTFIQDLKVATVPCLWNTVEQLRRVALSRGCTPAQFDYAVEVMGPSPQHVAKYLEQHRFAVGLSKGNLQTAQAEKANVGTNPDAG